MIGDTSPFVGRAEELAALRAALDSASAGRPGIVLVTGEAGIGKSRLVAQLLADTCGPLRVLIGESAPMVGPTLAYGPFVAALGALPTWLSPHGGDPAVARHRVFHELLATLTKTAVVTPVLLVLEDLHWADASSRDVLAYLSAALKQQRLLVVVTLRDDGLDGSTRNWLAELEQRPRVERLHLTGLDSASLMAIAADRPGAACRRQHLATALASAGGNPLLAKALVDAAPGRPPASISAAVLSRLSAVDHEARQVVELVSVSDSALRHDLLAAAMPLSEKELLAALRCAVTHGLLTADGDNYLFRHDVTRQVVYRHMLPGERRQMHRRLARALAQRVDGDPRHYRDHEPAELVALVNHWHRGGHPEQAVPAAVEAARHAMTVRAYPEAARLYALAVDFSPAMEHTGYTPVEVLDAAAEASYWAGDPTTAVRYATQALDYGAEEEAHTTAHRLERLGRYHWTAGHPADAVRATQTAVDLLADQPPSPLGARVLAALATGHMLLGEIDEAAPLAQRAVDLAVRLDAVPEQAYASAINGILQARSGDLSTGLATLNRAFELAVQVGSIEDIIRSATNTMFLLCAAGRFTEALRAADDGRRHATSLGAPPAMTALLGNNTAAILVATGRWDEAETLVATLIDDCVGQPAFTSLLGLLQLEIAVGRGEQQHVAELSARLLGHRDNPRLAGPLHACLAEAALDRGDAVTAATEVTAGLEALAGRLLPVEELRLLAAGLRLWADLASLPPAGIPVLLSTDGHLSYAALEQRAQALLMTASRQEPEAAAYAAQITAEMARRAGTGERHAWRQAAQLWNSAGQPHREAYARLQEAAAAIRAGRRHSAAWALSTCVGAAQRVGAAPLVAAAQSMASRHGLDPGDAMVASSPDWTSPFDLTRREAQVLERLILGETNRQIGRFLFISERTVAVHVSRILTKLGARNRTEAAAFARVHSARTAS